LTVKLADDMSESTELNMQVVKLHAQLERKGQQISQLTETKSQLVLPPRILGSPLASVLTSVDDAVVQERSLAELEKALEKERESVLPLKESLEKKTEEIHNLEQTLNLLREESEQAKNSLEDQVNELNLRKKRMLAITDFKAH
jgi:DNA repair exonuclease SbcCD ATPase subunit